MMVTAMMMMMTIGASIVNDNSIEDSVNDNDILGMVTMMTAMRIMVLMRMMKMVNDNDILGIVITMTVMARMGVMMMVMILVVVMVL